MLRSSNPAIMKVKDPQLDITGKGRGYIRLWFAPMEVMSSHEVFIFVNDEDDQNEDQDEDED